MNERINFAGRLDAVLAVTEGQGLMLSLVDGDNTIAVFPLDLAMAHRLADALAPCVILAAESGGRVVSNRDSSFLLLLGAGILGAGILGAVAVASNPTLAKAVVDVLKKAVVDVLKQRQQERDDMEREIVRLGGMPPSEKCAEVEETEAGS